MNVIMSSSGWISDSGLLEENRVLESNTFPMVACIPRQYRLSLSSNPIPCISLDRKNLGSLSPLRTSLSRPIVNTTITSALWLSTPPGIKCILKSRSCLISPSAI